VSLFQKHLAVVTSNKKYFETLFRST